jgi:hypothetical protein
MKPVPDNPGVNESTLMGAKYDFRTSKLAVGGNPLTNNSGSCALFLADDRFAAGFEAAELLLLLLDELAAGFDAVVLVEATTLTWMEEGMAGDVMGATTVVAF